MRFQAAIQLLVICFAIVDSANTQLSCLVDQVSSGDTTLKEYFGTSAAIAANRAVIGSPRDDDNGNEAGAVYVYERTGLRATDPTRGWEQVAKITQGAVEGDRFGTSVAISSDGSTIVVGAPRHEVGGLSRAGSVHVFRTDGNAWTHQQTFVSANPVELAEFGRAVGIDGDYIVVGAPGGGTPDENEYPPGSAHIFKRDSGIWSLEAILAPTNIVGEAQFGRSVAIDGDAVVVGAPNNSSIEMDISGDDPLVPYIGTAHVFRRNGQAWFEEAFLRADDWQATGVDALFGFGVGIDGSRIVIGAILGDGLSSQTGAAYFFAETAGAWTQEAKVFDNGGSLNEFFGAAVAINGAHALVGATRAITESEISTGAVTFYRRVDGRWIEDGFAAVMSPGDGSDGDRFGEAVALSDGYALVGAPRTDNREGTVFVYGYGSARDCNASGIHDDCEIIASQVPPPAPPGQFSLDADGNGTIDSCQCTDNTECDDGVFCNGFEACVDGHCTDGHIPCADSFCLEESDQCVDCLSDRDCDDGNPCSFDLCTAQGTCEYAEPSLDSLTTVFVDSHANGEQDGRSWCTAFRSLQDALVVARCRFVSRINVAEGTYRPDSGFGQQLGDRDASFTLIDDLTLVGGYAGCGALDPSENDPARYITELSGDLMGNDDDGVPLPFDSSRSDNSFHVVTADGTIESAVLEGMTIAGGHADADSGEFNGSGAGLHSASGNITLKRCRFLENFAGTGGGLFAYRGSPRLIECTFARNSALTGGGVYQLGGELSVIDSQFIGNSGLQAAGLYQFLGGVSLETCRFEDNSAFQGGAVFIEETDAEISRCSFESNLSVRGGAILVYLSQLLLESCSFVANVAQEKGGAIRSKWNESLALDNCTFMANDSPVGSAIYGEIDDTQVSNTILWGSEPYMIAMNPTPSIAYSIVQGGFTGIGNRDANPMFVRDPGPGLDGLWGTEDDDMGDLRLAPGSPAINTGDPAFQAGPGAVDLDGADRLRGCRVDRGAYESPEPQSFGDFDNDGSIDLRDFAFFQTCFDAAASQRDWQNTCRCVFDLYDDGAVDLSDHAGFEWIMTGP